MVSSCMAGVPYRGQIVYRILQQSECISPNGWVVARGQARPPETGGGCSLFSPSHSSMPCQLYLTPHLVRHHQFRPGCCRKVAPTPVPRADNSKHVEVQNLPQADTVRPPAQLGVYALQALTETGCECWSRCAIRAT